MLEIGTKVKVLGANGRVVGYYIMEASCGYVVELESGRWLEDKSLYISNIMADVSNTVPRL